MDKPNKYINYFSLSEFGNLTTEDVIDLLSSLKDALLWIDDSEVYDTTTMAVQLYLEAHSQMDIAERKLKQAEIFKAREINRKF